MSILTSHLHHGSIGSGTYRYSASVRSFAGRLVQAWRHHRAEAELESLPFDVRKDIGFPSTEQGSDLNALPRKTR
ncbi:hypothetical protein SAMN05892877_110216 [Rhizobium subbaraonis]|uniref:DUF1127 domain-containing protein n=1 Tax=Rhizobium subbaraonis TaxID=908946 RepID=A0A285UM34_9HYPH|nr:hypothetical protein [Rhizobium subbaraonis]SOC42930.1 hypothetical protein SAMN05892877_110216 [Rhizobium subbaraonis]